MGGIVVSGRARRCCHKRAIADQLVHAQAPVHTDPQIGGLRTGAQQADLIDRQRLMHLAIDTNRSHRKRIDDLFLSLIQPGLQVVSVVFVHQKANGPAVHPVNRHIKPLRRMQCLQHETVTAQRHDHIRLGLRDIAMLCRQFAQRRLCDRHRAGDKGDLGAGHGAKSLTGLISCAVIGPETQAADTKPDVTCT